MTEPIEKTDDESREMARRTRNAQWAFADKVAKHGTLWFCWWDKARRHHDRDRHPPDLFVTGLIDGMEYLSWFRAHPDWWQIGEWDDARYAAPVELTDAGRAALENRSLYDLEPVEYGMVTPGYKAIPAVPAA